MTQPEPPESPPPDAEIEALCRAERFDEATTLAITSYGSEVMGMLVRSLGDEERACDVFSRWSEDLWKSFESFQWLCSLRTWCYRLARNALSRHTRDPYRRRRTRLSSQAAAQIVEQVRQSTAPFMKTDVKDRFSTLREKLSEDEQWLLTLRVDRNMNWRDIAIIIYSEENPSDLDLPKLENRLMVRFHRLKDKLKRLAAQDGWF